MIVELEKYRVELAAIKDRLAEVGDGDFRKSRISRNEKALPKLREGRLVPGKLFSGLDQEVPSEGVGGEDGGAHVFG